MGGQMDLTNLTDRFVSLEKRRKTDIEKYGKNGRNLNR
jgi:hypothetical protein